MTKILLLVCDAAPRPPSHYLASLPKVGKSWSGAAWGGGTLGGIAVSEEAASPRVRKAYPWAIAKVLRVQGKAPPRDWRLFQPLADAVLADVGGAAMSTTGRLLAANLPHGARSALWDAIEAGVDGEGAALFVALEAAVKWGDIPFEKDLLEQLAEVLLGRRDPALYERVVALSHSGGPAAEWLKALGARGTPLVRMLEAADDAGVPLLPEAMTMLNEHRVRGWQRWAGDTPVEKIDLDALLDEAAAGGGRGETALRHWCETRRTSSEIQQALGAALTRFSARRGPWPEAWRKLLAALVRNAEDGAPLQAAGGSLHPDDARWVAQELATMAEERRRYEELVAGINARNAARYWRA
jgi:hypothetical protein